MLSITVERRVPFGSGRLRAGLGDVWEVFFRQLREFAAKDPPLTSDAAHWIYDDGSLSITVIPRCSDDEEPYFAVSLELSGLHDKIVSARTLPAADKEAFYKELAREQADWSLAGITSSWSLARVQRAYDLYRKRYGSIKVYAAPHPEDYLGRARAVQRLKLR